MYMRWGLVLSHPMHNIGPAVAAPDMEACTGHLACVAIVGSGFQACFQNSQSHNLKEIPSVDHPSVKLTQG